MSQKLEAPSKDGQSQPHQVPGQIGRRPCLGPSGQRCRSAASTKYPARKAGVPDALIFFCSFSFIKERKGGYNPRRNWPGTRIRRSVAKNLAPTNVRNLFRAKDRQLHTFANLFSGQCSVLQRFTVPSLDGFFFEPKGRTSFLESSFFMLKLRTPFFNRTFFGRKPITPIF